jgi:signal transduction histidine kinase
MQNNASTLFTEISKTTVPGHHIKISYIPRRRKRETATSDELERLQSAIASLKSGTWTFDISTNSLMVCGRCKELIPALKVTGSIIEGQEVIANSDHVLESFYKALTTHTAFDIEVSVSAVNNHDPKWLRITGTTNLSRSNVVPKMHGSIEDISCRKQLEILRQDYLAIASHDLRSPLSVIKLYIQLCEREAYKQGNHLVQEMLKKSGLQVDKMNSMLECYLESPATDAGTYFPECFVIQDVFEEMIHDLRLLYPGHHISLKPDTGIMVFADRGKIGQVVQNLLSNAIKFSSQSEAITIKFQRLKCYVQVEICDHGIGIKPADQEKIFDRFYRAERVNDMPIKGYGIGLFLTKQIIKQHHGDIWLKSAINKGSTFYFTLPYSNS